MFSSELIAFIAENFDRKDFCDKAFLEKFRRVLVSSYDIEDRLLSIEPARLGKNTTFIYENNKTFFDMRRLNKEMLDKSRKKGVQILTKYHTSYEWFVGILHEHLHIIEDIMCADDKDMSTYTEVLRDGLSILEGNWALGKSNSSRASQRLRSNRLYTQYHDIFPGERRANTISNLVMIQFFKRLYPDKRDILESFKNVFLGILMDGYESGIYSCPLEEFYHRIRRPDVFVSYDFSQYENFEKFLYGMPLGAFEVEKEKQKVRTI